MFTKKKMLWLVSLVAVAISCTAISSSASQLTKKPPEELSVAYKLEEASRIKEAIEASEIAGETGENPLMGVFEENLPLDGSLNENPFK